jgi:cell division protein FtsQ
MKFKFDVKRELKIAAAILVVIVFIAFTERKQETVSIGEVSVKIVNSEENHFLDESDVTSLMQLNMQRVRGAKPDEVNLKAIEKKILKDPFIKDAELYTDLKGNLIVGVELRRPIARIVRNDGPDGYIAEDGTIMPVSDKFTARVILVSGPYVRKLLQQRNLNQNDEGARLLYLINQIRDDEFWNAQITQLDIDSKGRITMLPQVGDERIEFGKAENEEVKLNKLKTFYKDVLPKTGWNKFKRINLEYEGQIVAE